jgi:sugar O-acyltransferase (sialic acid O-acetyltransferase NeuD family)
MEEIIFWGATGQSIVLADFIEEAGYKLVAIFDRNKKLKSPIKEVQLFTGDQVDQWFVKQKKKIHFAIAIGGTDGTGKLQLYDMLVEKGLLPTTLIHPTAFVSTSAVISEGCQVLANATVIAKAKLGKACIVNTKASIDHECIIGDGVHIAPGATLAGCVEVGSGTFIGTGAVVLPRIKIGKNVVIGAGAVVTKNISDGSVAYGNPAIIRR